jgi:hypothetical protein
MRFKEDTMRKFFRMTPALALATAALSTSCDEGTRTVAVDQTFELTPATVDFGAVQVNSASLERQIEIRNTGGAPLTIDITPAEGQDDASAFTIDIQEETISPNSVGFITAVFRPIELKNYEAVYNVSSRIRGQDVSVELTLTGIGQNSAITVEPTELLFGQVIVGTEKPLAITVTNNSEDINALVEFFADNNIDVCGQPTGSAYCIEGPGNFEDDQAFPLDVGQTVDLTINFRPLVPGVTERGALTLDSCGSGIPDASCQTTVQLIGIAVNNGFVCDPASLDFGPVTPGSSLSRIVTCTNVANQQLTVTGWEIDSQSSDFQLGPVQPTVLPPPEGDNPGGAVDIEVTYEPLTLGNDLGFLVINTDDPNPLRARIQIPLAGSGGGPDISVTPTQLNFGLCSNIAPCPRSVIVGNNGLQTLNLTSINVDVDATGAFSSEQAGTDVISIEPGETVELRINFQPPVIGTFESRMVIQSNDGDEPETEVFLVGEGIELEPCDFELSSSLVNFGVVQSGQVAFRGFEIRNRSPINQCLVTGLRLDPTSDPEFRIDSGNIDSFLLEPGANLGVRNRFFSQVPGQYGAKVEFSISNPDTPFNTVDLAAIAADSTLLIVPSELAFGTIEIGCSARARTVTVYNTGQSPATINSITVDSEPGVFTLVGNPGAQVLPPGQSFEFQVGFTAPGPNPSDYIGAVELEGTFNGMNVLYVVALSGRGDRDAVQSDNFEQLGRPEVDLLFVIDDSCSMGDDQANLAANFASFIEFAESQALDYNIGVTTTDLRTNAPDGEYGRFVPLDAAGASRRVVTPQTSPSPDTVFRQNVQVGTATGLECAFEGGYLATQPAILAPGGHNENFLRQDAVLSVIFVTDEPEQSAGAACQQISGNTNATVDFYLNWFLALKADRQLITASSISQAECGSTDPRTLRLRNIATRSNGVSAPLCTDNWARTLEDLSRQAFGFKSRFFLTNQPVIQSLRVFLDGAQMPATEAGGRVNWTYDFSSNSVNFNPLAVPEPGVQVLIEYTPECIRN